MAAVIGPLIQGAFAGALERNRARYNALFAQARRNAPGLRGEEFGGFLADVVGPTVEAVARRQPECVDAVADALYELALELVSKDLPARHPAIGQGWRILLENLPDHLAADPRLFAASVTNALYNLSLTPGARPVEWIRSMIAVGASCPAVARLLDAGKVAAWRAGMAHFRESALDVCERLDDETALAALGLDDMTLIGPIAHLIRRLRSDPWLDPRSPAGPEFARKPRIMARVGAFRGFGGLFLRPPTVTASEGDFVVMDGESAWTLYADRFGATFQRRREPASPSGSGSGVGFELDASGRVTHAGISETFIQLRGASSHAVCANTLAVTLPLSHTVFLVAAA